MANDILKSINAQSFDALAQQGLIKPETYQRVQSQMVQPQDAAALIQQADNNMSVMREQEQPQIALPDLANPAYLQPFTPEGTRERANLAAQTGDVDEAARLSSIVEEQEMEKQAAIDSEINRKKAKYAQDLEKINNHNQRAAAQGLQTMPVPTAEQYGIPREKMPATDEDLVQSQLPSVEEVEQEAAPIRKAAAQQVAVVKEQDRQINAAMEKENEIKGRMQALEDAEDAALKAEQAKNPYGDTWGDRLRIAMAVGLGSLGKENPAMKMIEAKQQEIKENRKLNLEQKLAREKRQLDLAKFELEKMNAQTDSEHKKAQIAKLYSEVNEKSNETAIKLQFALRAASGDGFDAQEVFSMDPKMQGAFVGGFKDGKLRPSVNPEASKKLMMEVIPANSSALRDLGRLKEINKQFLSGSLDLTGARKEAETLQRSLIGGLRLELFGPGVLTDAEQEAAKKIIANPTAIFSLKDSSDTALTTLMEKLKYGTRIKMKAAGIQLPESKNDVKIKQIMEYSRNKGKSISSAQAMSDLIKANRWDNEDDLF